VPQEIFLAPSGTPLLIQAIIAANIAIFLLALALFPFQWNLGSPMNALTPNYRSLLLLGATGTLIVRRAWQLVSLVTAGYLHSSLLHIVFNMIAVRHLGGLSVAIYGPHRTFLIYTFSSVAGFAVSCLAGIHLTVGASASVCGLIGAILWFGRSEHHPIARALTRQATGWLIGLLFMVLIPNVNNWGHGGGLVSGIILAAWMKPRRRPHAGPPGETPPYRILAILVGGLVLATLLRTAVAAILFRLG